MNEMEAMGTLDSISDLERDSFEEVARLAAALAVMSGCSIVACGALAGIHICTLLARVDGF